MAKELCKLKKELKNGISIDYMMMVNNPKYICKKCGRAANSKKNLCAPQKISL